MVVAAREHMWHVGDPQWVRTWVGRGAWLPVDRQGPTVEVPVYGRWLSGAAICFKYAISSIGSGNTMVEFFSAAISVSVWR